MMTFYRLIEVCLVIEIFAQTQAFGDISVPENDVYYTGGFVENVAACKDFKNEFLTSTLDLATSDDDPSLLVLKGEMYLNADITPLHTVSVTVCKHTIAGCELLYTIVGNICETLKDTFTPWYPLVAAFDRDECDILKGSYTVNNMQVTLENVKDFINYQYVGEYRVEMSIMLKSEKLSCYDMIVSVEEKQG